MINLKSSFFKSWARNHKGLAIALLVLAFIGFLDASFLTVKHVNGLPVPCSIVKGCESVLSSKYADIGGIPTALLGSVYYLAVFFLAATSIIGKDVSKAKKHLLVASKLTLMGFVASLFFVFLQLFVIKAICLYCMISAVVSTTLFVLGIIAIRQNKRLETLA